jgi:light-regulated signal transduction histidine kinase (bacteriophytochrome)
MRVKERTAELEKKNDELEQFAHVSSHDLQEPLRKILMFTGMIREKEYDNFSEFSKSRFDKITDAVARMSRSLKDLLNFTSLTKEEQFADVDFEEAVGTVENDLELVIAQKGAIIYKENLPVLKSIPLQIHQLFYNLINNALKFSKPDIAPEIRISCRKLNEAEKGQFKELDPVKEYYEIILKDNGIGFEQSYAEKIFVMFQRLHDKQKFGGTGIGLALCKKVVINHGGLIYAFSKPGEGASFHIILPNQ